MAKFRVNGWLRRIFPVVGLVVTVALPLAAAPRQAISGKVLWIVGQSVTAAFACGQPLQAQIGLVPVYHPDSENAVLYARVKIGRQQLDFPLGADSQDSLCGANLTLRRSQMKSACPALRVDDGLCDAFHIYWDADRKVFDWQRR